MSKKKNSAVRDALRNRMQEEANKEGSWGRRVLDTSNYEDVGWYIPQLQENLIDIIPYIIEGENHPENKDGAITGEPDYVLDIKVHRRVGPANDDFVCPQTNYGLPCPLCEEKDLMIKEGRDYDDVPDELKPKRRVFYNVIDLLSDDDNIMLFESSYYGMGGTGFGESIIEEAESGDEEGGYILFSDPEDGMSISFQGKKKTYAGHEYVAIKKIQFEDRDEQYEDNIMEEAYPLDGMIVLMSYDEIAEAYFGASVEEEDLSKSKKASRKRIRKNVDIDEEEEVEEEVEEEEEEEEVVPKKPRTRKVVQESLIDIDEEEEEEEVKKAPAKKAPAKKAPAKKAPAKKAPAKKAPAATKSKKEETPARRRGAASTKSKSPVCPSKHKFGEDCDKFNDCYGCDLWESCSDAHDLG